MTEAIFEVEKILIKQIILEAMYCRPIQNSQLYKNEAPLPPSGSIRNRF